MKIILEIIYRVALSLFEFIIDLLIIFLSVVILKGIFGDNIYVNSIVLLIVFCGLVYGIHDAIEVYNENKLKK
jgi:hypothetical protein